MTVKNLETINDNIEKHIGTASKIPTVVIVTKKREPNEINKYLGYLGKNKLKFFFDTQFANKCIIGENYVQEYEKKSKEINGKYSPHLIGRLQESNVKKAVELFDMIQSCHSIKILKAINKEAGKINKVQSIFLQVNISNDPEKGGFAVEELLQLLETWDSQKYNHLKLIGLMTITKDYDLKEDVRKDYRSMKLLQDIIHSKDELAKLFNDSFCHLSMGMSNDYEIAIQEGATIVRIGSAIWST